nr:MAG TPA: hypothetical protein [Caudoviricetes sp.]
MRGREALHLSILLYQTSTLHSLISYCILRIRSLKRMPTSKIVL